MHRASIVALAAAALTAACSDGPTATAVTPTSPSSPNTTVDCSTPLALTVGQVVAGVTGTSFCVTAGTTTAQYALIPFNGSTDAAASFAVAATGTSSPSALTESVLAGGLSADIVTSTGSLNATPHRSFDFEKALRMRERSTLTPLVSSARKWNAKRLGTRAAGAAFDVIPSTVTVGQRLTLNANGTDACTAPAYHSGRVVAITNHAIVVADTANPTGGYTDAEYASFGTTFDTLIDPLDRGAFGDPSDIDGNGRVVLFFTKAVNDLTPKSSTSYIGGYFFARDLFPAKSTVDFDACAASNVGEMFYVMVPDESRGGAFAKANVADEVYATLAHEYQHLINASRRMYVNTAATDFEETWLDEGLAHTAEELLFFRVSGLQPRQNYTVTNLRQSSAILSAFNSYDSDNFGRYDAYLLKPSSYSAYADNDSLETRGATRAFLRYATDRAGTTDGTTWFQLVNSTTTGLTNLQNVFGANVINEMRDWGVSVLTDDLTGVAAAYQQPTWNYRSIFAALENSSVFPLSTVSLSAGSHTVSLVRGANAYLRFSVAAGGSATVQWTGAPSTVQFSVVRTQ